MRIAYIANIRFPSERAHAVQIVHMCNAFSNAGHAVDLFVTNRRTDIDSDPAHYYGTPLSFAITRVSIPDIVGALHRLPHFLHPYAYMLGRFCFAIRAASMLRHEKYDVVYGRDEWLLFVLNLLMPRQNLVWESHEAKHNYPARILLRRKIPVVAISEGIRDVYLAQGYDSSRILVAHDGIDVSFFGLVPTREAARRRLGLPLDRFIALYIGGFDAWKGVTTLLEASAHTNVLIAAIGGSETTLATLKQKYPKVIFLGSRPYRELKEHQQAADVLVIPNTGKNALSASYTSPLKLFAHMSSGVPILASDIPSIRAILDDTHATFFTPDDSLALAAGLQAIAEDREGTEEKAMYAKEEAKRYTWEHRAVAISDFVARFIVR